MANVHVTPEMIEQIKTANPIEEVVGEYVKLKREGDAYVGLCPFHEEDTPSFYIYPATQSFHCYGCDAGVKGQSLKRMDGSTVTDAGSDVVAFIQNIEGKTFQEACVVLMERAGIPVPVAVLDPEELKIKRGMTDRNRRYWNELNNNPTARQAILDRGITSESINTFRIGLVPLDDPKQNIRGRFAFGIMEVSGGDNPATIAMAYRTSKGEEPKWRNDENNKCFTKKKTLYLLSHAWKAIRKMGFAIVVEGYVDAVIAHQSGLPNTVAAMTNSVSEEQAAVLRRYTDTVYLWLDDDPRGRAGAIKSLPVLLAKGFKVMLVESQPWEDSYNRDPDEIMNHLQQVPHEVIDWMINHSRPALEIIIEKAIDNYNQAVKPHQAKIDQARAETLQSLMPILSVCRPGEQEVYKAVVMKRLGL